MIKENLNMKKILVALMLCMVSIGGFGQDTVYIKKLVDKDSVIYYEDIFCSQYTLNKGEIIDSVGELLKTEKIIIGYDYIDKTSYVKTKKVYSTEDDKIRVSYKLSDGYEFSVSIANNLVNILKIGDPYTYKKSKPIFDTIYYWRVFAHKTIKIYKAIYEIVILDKKFNEEYLLDSSYIDSPFCFHIMNCDSNIKRIEILNFLGQTCLSVSPINGELFINARKFASNLYFIRIYENYGKITIHNIYKNSIDNFNPKTINIKHF